MPVVGVKKSRSREATRKLRKLMREGIVPHVELVSAIFTAFTGPQKVAEEIVRLYKQCTPVTQIAFLKWLCKQSEIITTHGEAEVDLDGLDEQDVIHAFRKLMGTRTLNVMEEK